MSAPIITSTGVWDTLESALKDAEEAIGNLEYEGAFAVPESGLPLYDDDMDTDSIKHNITRLEAALDIVADELSQRIDPDADEEPTLDEILARFVRKGVVTKEVVETAARLSEGLGTVGSTVGLGVHIYDFDSSALTNLVNAVHELVDYLRKASP